MRTMPGLMCLVLAVVSGCSRGSQDWVSTGAAPSAMRVASPRTPVGDPLPTPVAKDQPTDAKQPIEASDSTAAAVESPPVERAMPQSSAVEEQP